MRPRICGSRSSLAALWLAGLLLLPGFMAPVTAQLPIEPERNVRLANVVVFSTAPQTPLILALGTDTEAINITVITREILASMTLEAFNSTLTDSDVIFVDRFLPETLSYLHILVSHVNGTFENDGLVMFGIMQNSSTPGDGDLAPAQVSAIAPVLPINLTTGYVNSTGNMSAPGFVIQVLQAPSVPENSTILVTCIPWATCPLIDRRLVVAAKPGATPVLTDTAATESVLAEWSLGGNGSQIMSFSMVITEYNFLFTSFIYFSYFMYVVTFHALGNYSDALIESWEEWPFSAGYGGEMPWTWIVMVALLGVVAVWLYLKRRKMGVKAADGKAVATRDAGKDDKTGDAKDTEPLGGTGAPGDVK